MNFIDSTLHLPPNCKVVYLGGGCFWGVEKLFSSFEGVIDTAAGYANGKDNIIPDYKRVCKGDTEYIETVRVVYKSPATFTALIEALFSVIDLTAKNRQGGDIGAQYQSAVFFADRGKKRGKKYLKNIPQALRDFPCSLPP